MADWKRSAPFDLSGSPHRVKGRGLRISLPERIRAARRIPQAIVKVTSYSSGLHQVIGHLRYISRKGLLTLETNSGERLEDQANQEALAASWSMDFGSRKRSRDTANIVFSMPPRSDVEALRKTVRSVGARAFEGHEWVFGIHEDRDHPHAHMMVKMKGEGGRKKLRLRKADLYRLRETFAEAAREQDVQLAASPRAARGIHKKGIRLAEYHLRKKGIAPPKRTAELDRPEVRSKKDSMNEQPWERAMATRHKRERDVYFAEATALRQAAQARQGEDHEKLRNAAQQLEDFARSLPAPMTRAQALGKNFDQATSAAMKKHSTGGKQENQTELER